MNFVLQLTTTGESVEVDFSEDCYETVTKALQQRFKVRNLVFGDHLKVHINYITTNDSIGSIELQRNDPRKKLQSLLEKIKVGHIKTAVAYWTAQSRHVYEYGTGVKNIANKKLIADSIIVSSHDEFSVSNVMDNYWGDIKDLSKKAIAPATRAPFELLADSNNLINISDDSLIYIAGNELFVNNTFAPYSNLNDRVLLKFDISFPVQPKYTPDPAEYLFLMRAVEPPEWLSTLRTFIKTLETEKGDMWARCVNSSLAELNEWSQVIPMLCGYNERTRRVIAETISKQVCLFLGVPYMTEVPQNYGVPLPGQLGTGGVDIKIGSAVLYSAREVETPQLDLYEEEEKEEKEQQEQRAGNFNRPAKHMDKSLAQLSGQCNDSSLISPAEQLAILYATGESADTQRIYTGMKAMPMSLLGKRDRAEGRVYSDVAGVLTTGHKWQFFNYHTDSLDVTARPRITYRGELSLPVLTYASPGAFFAVGSRIAPSVVCDAQSASYLEPRGSAAEAQPSGVRKDDVEMVMAALVLASRTGLKLDAV